MSLYLVFGVAISALIFFLYMKVDDPSELHFAAEFSWNLQLIIVIWFETASWSHLSPGVCLSLEPNMGELVDSTDAAVLLHYTCSKAISGPAFTVCSMLEELHI